MQKRFLLLGAAIGLSLSILLCVNPSARAQGILYPEARIRIQPFYVKNLRVNTVITDAVAETTVEQTFVNDSPAPQEGTYLFPLPEGATPTAFSMTVGDRTMEPRILSKEEARRVYESIVRSRRDPALLEYVGRNLVRISVFPIPARGERLIRLRYTEPLKLENGLRKYAYTLSTSRFGARPVGAASVNIKVRTSVALKNIYSPSHNLSIRRPDDRSATLSWEGTNDASDQDLSVYFSTSDQEVGLSLLAYRSGDRDGYFMLMAAPPVTIARERILPKQIVFVLDRTGSMAGEKIKQARNALLFCLNKLRPQDRFSVITFNESSDMLFRRLEPASEANVTKAKQFVQDIEASGGTNIDEALRATVTLMKSEAGSQKMVIFLTDGLPTVGETNPNTILQHFKEWSQSKRLTQNPPRTSALAKKSLALAANASLPLQEEKDRAGQPSRVFCFGVGYDVNVPFLDSLAEMGRGDTDYVKPEEDIEVKVSGFFAKISSPILSQLRLAFDGADVYDVFPKELPDLFKGTQLVVTGRFRGRGDGTVRLAGTANGKQESFRLAADFGAADGRHAFLPRLWAARKIGYLVDQIRLANNPAGQKEVIDEVVRLSREYGIITEYTSFLVDEQELTTLGIRGGVGGIPYDNLRVREEVARRAAANGTQGEAATNQSLRAKDLYLNDQVSSRYQAPSGEVYALGRAAQPDSSATKPGRGNYLGGRFGGGVGGGGIGGGGLGASASNRVMMQAVKDRAFSLQKNNVWQDNTYDPKKQKLIRVQAFSDAHFALIKALPELGVYSSVGEEVIVRLGKNALHIGKEGKEKLTPAEMKELTL